VPDPAGINPVPQLVTFLDQNHPNPFNPSTIIRYGIKEGGHVSLKVYNVAGQLVKTLVNDVKTPAAEYKVTWDGKSDSGNTVASGVYFYRLVTKDFTRTRKMVILK
jgi:flagellar hook assembly protein FlgD